MDQAGGYDYQFVEALSEDFTCVFCHLALKNPLQVEDCGHIFCKGCFDQMKQNAETNSEDLCCPLDREKIDPTHVFKDKALERRVLSLNVKCSNFGDECEWSGELREVKKNRDKVEVMASVKELEQLVNRINDLENKAKSHDEKLEEKDSLIKELSEKLENQKKQIKRSQFKKMIMPNVVNESNYSMINTSFQWKFNIDKVRSGIQSVSPPFYIPNGHCFQLASFFVSNSFRIALYRYRGQYDYATNEITLTQDFKLKIYVLGRNGNEKSHLFKTTNDYKIEAFKIRSRGYFVPINSNEIDHYAIDGHIHLNCIFN